MAWKRLEKSLTSLKTCFKGLKMHFHCWNWKCCFADLKLKEPLCIGWFFGVKQFDWSFIKALESLLSPIRIAAIFCMQLRAKIHFINALFKWYWHVGCCTLNTMHFWATCAHIILQTSLVLKNQCTICYPVSYGKNKERANPADDTMKVFSKTLAKEILDETFLL